MPMEPTSFSPFTLWISVSLFIAFFISKYIEKKIKLPSDDEVEKDYFNSIPFYKRFLKGGISFILWVGISSAYFIFFEFR
jgi:hypothetical protein